MAGSHSNGLKLQITQIIFSKFQYTTFDQIKLDTIILILWYLSH